MKHIAALVAGIALASASHAMTVADFLVRADALKAKGAMALFSSDIRLLKNEVVGAAGQLRAERLAAVQAGRRPAYCPPAKGGGMNSDELLSAFRALPADQRARMQVKDGLRLHMARKHPCPT